MAFSSYDTGEGDLRIDDPEEVSTCAIAGIAHCETTAYLARMSKGNGKGKRKTFANPSPARRARIGRGSF